MQKIRYIVQIILLAFLFACNSEDSNINSNGNEEFTILVSANEGGIVSTEGGQFEKGTELTITAIPNLNFVFDKWDGINSNESTINITVESDLTLVANFVEKTVNFDFQAALPILQITTDVPIENEPKVAGDLVLYENGEITLEQKIGIEFRGSTSFRLSDKKSYGIETWDQDLEDLDVSLLGMPEEEDWILMGHVFRASQATIFDPTLMRHFIGYELYRSMGNYASRCEFVELSVNGDYKGVYIFMEKLKRDKERIDVNKLGPKENDAENITGGYILKIDKTSGGDVATNQPLSYYESNWQDDATYNENISFRSAYSTDGNLLDFDPYDPPYHANQFLETYFLYEYPKASTISDQQKEYIQDYIFEFETALLEDDFNTEERTYTDYIDINSFVDYFLLTELVGNIDAYRLSTYLYKDKGEKLNMGPVWDLNIGYGDGRIPVDDWIINYNEYVPTDPWLVPFWWPRLMEDPLFTAAVKERWTILRSNELSTSTVVDLVRNTSNYLQENGAIERNYCKWTGIEIDYENEVNEMVDYLQNRLIWMDSAIGAF